VPVTFAATCSRYCGRKFLQQHDQELIAVDALIQNPLSDFDRSAAVHKRPFDAFDGATYGLVLERLRGLILNRTPAGGPSSTTSDHLEPGGVCVPATEKE
jgi:hypothetical protein